MKAVVVELKSGFAAVLSDDGCIVTIKNNNFEVGQVIRMNNSKMHLIKKITMFAASAAAFVVLGVGTWAYATPYTYVSVDVNPSIEFTVNRFDRVLRVTAINDDGDGEEILKELSLADLENKTIEDALAMTVDQISELGYFDYIEGGLVIATSSENLDKAEDLAQELQQIAESEITQNGDIVVVDAFSVRLERVEEARALGVTPGKLNLVEKLQESAADPSTVDLNAWLNRPVKDIMKATKDNKHASSATGSALIIETKQDDKIKAWDERIAEKANQEAEKAKKEAEKTSEKAKTANERAEAAAKRATEADERANEKSKNAFDMKAEKEKYNNENASKKAIEDSKKVSDRAKSDANKADMLAEEAGKVADDARKAAEKANDDAEKAAKKAEKAKKAAKAADHKASENKSDKSKNESNRDDDESSGNRGNSNNRRN